MRLRADPCAAWDGSRSRLTARRLAVRPQGYDPAMLALLMLALVGKILLLAVVGAIAVVAVVIWAIMKIL